LVLKGTDRISSGSLSELTGYTASQIRQDFNNFGGFGQQGYGYNTKSLLDKITEILGLDGRYKVVLVGVGNMGRALLSHRWPPGDDIEFTALFDVSPAVVGKEIMGFEVKHIDELEKYLSENKTDIGIITTNKDGAQGVADALSKGGVRGIWNFAPADITVGEGVVFQSVHLSDSLNELIYYVNNPN
jgi:redox-sensing transcriptional repressor